MDFQKNHKIIEIEQIKSQVIARLAPKYNVPILKKTKNKKKPWTIYKLVKLSKNQATCI